MNATPWLPGQAPGQGPEASLGIDVIDRSLGHVESEIVLFLVDSAAELPTGFSLLRSTVHSLALIEVDDHHTALEQARRSLIAGTGTVFVGAADNVPDELHALSSVVITLGEGRLHVVKADGRSTQLVGATYSYTVGEDDTIQVRRYSTAAMFGRSLRSIRIDRGLKQADVARMAGVSVSAISQVEHGKQSLSLETAADLAAKLGLTVDALLHGNAVEYTVVRPSGRKVGATHPQLDIELLPIDVPARGAVAPSVSGDSGGLLHVVEGTVLATVGSVRTVLRAGETLVSLHGSVSDLRSAIGRPARVVWTSGKE